MTQTNRVLAALYRAGRAGITQVDFALPNVIDGGAPITRVAARIKDLRDTGVRIEVIGTRHSCAVYALVQLPTPVPALQPNPRDPQAQEALF